MPATPTAAIHPVIGKVLCNGKSIFYKWSIPGSRPTSQPNSGRRISRKCGATGTCWIPWNRYETGV